MSNPRCIRPEFRFSRLRPDQTHWTLFTVENSELTQDFAPETAEIVRDTPTEFSFKMALPCDESNKADGHYRRAAKRFFLSKHPDGLLGT